MILQATQRQIRQLAHWYLEQRTAAVIPGTAEGDWQWAEDELARLYTRSHGQAGFNIVDPEHTLAADLPWRQ